MSYVSQGMCFSSTKSPPTRVFVKKVQGFAHGNSSFYASNSKKLFLSLESSFFSFSSLSNYSAKFSLERLTRILPAAVVLIILFCILCVLSSYFITSLFVSIQLVLPVFLLTFFSAVIHSVTSFAWSEFVFCWIVWSVAGCTFKGFWNERGCCSSFFFVQDLEISDGTLVSLLCRFHEPRTCCFIGLLDTLTVVIEAT